MLTFRINLAILTLSNILLLAMSDEEKLQNRLSFDVPRYLLKSSDTEHLHLTGKNLANISTNDSIFNIHLRYSIHDYRLAIMDSNDDHELYKVMCNPYMKCRILQHGMELIRLNGTIKPKVSYKMILTPTAINLGSNWTMLTSPDERKAMLFHASYSNRQPLVEFVPYEIYYPEFSTSNYSLNIVRQSLFEPAFLIAMSIAVNDIF